MTGGGWVHIDWVWRAKTEISAKYHARPFGLKAALRLLPDSDLIEYVSTENKKDWTHLWK